MSLEKLEQNIDILTIGREVDTSEIGQLGSSQALGECRRVFVEASTGKKRERQGDLHTGVRRVLKKDQRSR
jgi:hypothetical protein